MGDKKPTTRTLPTGEKATHHPDGRVVLQPRNSLVATLNAKYEENEAASAALRDALVEAATAKRESLDAGTPVPPEKRAI